MSAEELAKLCVLLEMAYTSKVLDVQKDEQAIVYGIAWNKGVEMCHGKAIEFYQLCDIAKQGGV